MTAQALRLVSTHSSVRKEKGSRVRWSFSRKKKRHFRCEDFLFFCRCKLRISVKENETISSRLPFKRYQEVYLVYLFSDDDDSLAVIDTQDASASKVPFHCWQLLLKLLFVFVKKGCTFSHTREERSAIMRKMFNWINHLKSRTWGIKEEKSLKSWHFCCILRLDCTSLNKLLRLSHSRIIMMITMLMIVIIIMNMTDEVKTSK